MREMFWLFCWLFCLVVLLDHRHSEGANTFFCYSDSLVPCLFSCSGKYEGIKRRKYVYLLSTLLLIWTITPAGFAISSHLNKCQEIAWSQQKTAPRPSSPHKSSVLPWVLEQVIWLHSWTQSPKSTWGLNGNSGQASEGRFSHAP